MLREMIRELVLSELRRALSGDEPVVPGIKAPPEPVRGFAEILAEAEAPAKALRRKPNHKKQLCPFPGCKQAAAPVFGMVCAKHKDVPKAEIALYRAVRKGELPKAELPGKLRALKAPKAKKVAKAKPAKPAPKRSHKKKAPALNSAPAPEVAPAI